jgi:hypothetical protein
LYPGIPLCRCPGVDFILRSSDGADFYVHRAFLALASPVTIFRDIFTLPQTESGPAMHFQAFQSRRVPLFSIAHNIAILLSRGLSGGCLDTRRVAGDPGSPDLEIRHPMGRSDAKSPSRDVPHRSASRCMPSPSITRGRMWQSRRRAKHYQFHSESESSIRLLLQNWTTCTFLPLHITFTIASTISRTRCSAGAKVVTEALRLVSSLNDYVWFSCRARL